MKPEPLLLINTYHLAIPVSQAASILPHLMQVETTYNGDTKGHEYKLRDTQLNIQMIDANTVTAMLVAHKMENP